MADEAGVVIKLLYQGLHQAPRKEREYKVNDSPSLGRLYL
jgi:hypothetical protein